MSGQNCIFVVPKYFKNGILNSLQNGKSLSG